MFVPGGGQLLPHHLSGGWVEHAGHRFAFQTESLLSVNSSFKDFTDGGQTFFTFLLVLSARSQINEKGWREEPLRIESGSLCHTGDGWTGQGYIQGMLNHVLI